MKRNIVVLLCVVVFLGIAIYQNWSKANQQTVLPKEEAPRVNFLAPSFSLDTIDEQTYAVGGKRDKALLINFWASWCGPCEEEAPDLVELYEKYHDRLDIYAVNVTTFDSMIGARKFVERFGFQFPVLYDLEGDVTEKYKVRAFPTSFYVDQNGVILEVFPRMLLPNDLKTIEKHLRNIVS